MSLQHLKWAKSGRHFAEIDDKTGKPTGRNVLYTGVGSQNVDLGKGKYAPYVWDAVNKIAKFANSELRLTNNGVEIFRDGLYLYSYKIHPEKWDGSKWVRDDVVKSSLSVAEFSSPESPKESIEIAYTLVTSYQTTTVKQTVGSNGTVRHKWEVTNDESVKSTQRIVVENDIIDKGVAITRKKTGEHVGYHYPEYGVLWKWKPAEEEGRTLLTDDDVKVELAVNEKEYNPGETVKVSPDETTLEAGFSCESEDGDTLYCLDGADWVGNYAPSGDYRAAEQWTISGLDATDDVTAVEFRCYLDSKVGSPGTLSVNRYGTSHGEDDASDDTAANLFSRANGTNYTTIAEWSASNWCSWTALGATAESDIEWCRDNAHTVWALGLKTAEGGGDNRYEIAEYNETNDAELKITYTPAAAGEGVELFRRRIEGY